MSAHRVRLERPRPQAWKGGAEQYYARESLPFVESGAGTYTHRIRSLTLYDYGKHGSHAAVSCWCGMTMCLGGRRKYNRRIVAVPSVDRMVCATCEGRAIGAGQLGAREIAGRQVMYSPRRIKIEIEL